MKYETATGEWPVFSTALRANFACFFSALESLRDFFLLGALGGDDASNSMSALSLLKL